jgi:hypothetical protein
MPILTTLLTDGASDVVLVRILKWLIAQQTAAEVEVLWADLRGLRRKPEGLVQRIAAAIEIYPCQILFVHRDAENQEPELRYREVATAAPNGLAHVAIVPVRMQEAWLLHDEAALREAAGRPSGRNPLNLPSPDRWERLPDPKSTLHDALLLASGATGRRAKQFNPAAATHRMADLVTDWSQLRRLSAFKRLEDDTRSALVHVGIAVRS